MKPYATPNGTAWKIAPFPTLRFTIKNDFHATNKLPSSLCIKHDTIFVPYQWHKCLQETSSFLSLQHEHFCTKTFSKWLPTLPLNTPTQWHRF